MRWSFTQPPLLGLFPSVKSVSSAAENYSTTFTARVFTSRLYTLPSSTTTISFPFFDAHSPDENILHIRLHLRIESLAEDRRFPKQFIGPRIPSLYVTTPSFVVWHDVTHTLVNDWSDYRWGRAFGVSDARKKCSHQYYNHNKILHGIGRIICDGRSPIHHSLVFSHL